MNYYQSLCMKISKLFQRIPKQPDLFLKKNLIGIFPFVSVCSLCGLDDI